MRVLFTAQGLLLLFQANVPRITVQLRLPAFRYSDCRQVVAELRAELAGRRAKTSW
jgi:hypothetical protein